MAAASPQTPSQPALWSSAAVALILGRSLPHAGRAGRLRLNHQRQSRDIIIGAVLSHFRVTRWAQAVQVVFIHEFAQPTYSSSS